MKENLLFPIIGAVVMPDCALIEGESIQDAIFRFGPVNTEYKTGYIDKKGIGFASKTKIPDLTGPWAIAISFLLPDGQELTASKVVKVYKEARNEVGKS